MLDHPGFSPPTAPAPRFPDCHKTYRNVSTASVNVRNINVGNADVTYFADVTREYPNTVHPLPSVTFSASALIPLARRVGLSAVVAAYDRGLSVPAVRS